MSNALVITPALIEKAERTLSDMFIIKSGTIMATFLLLYDMITTYALEIEFVWGNHWSLSKLIFLVNRYVTLLGFGFHLWIQFIKTPSDLFCHISQPIDILMGAGITSILTTVLVTRVWALYGRTRKVLLIIGASYLVVLLPAYVVVMIKGVKMYNEADHQIVHDLDKFFEGSSDLVGAIYLGCQYPWFPDNIYILFACSLTWESVMLAAMAWKVSSMYSLRTGVLQYMLRDGLVYYVAMFITLLTGSIFSSGSAGVYPRAFVSSAYVTGIKSVMCSHLLLRLKGYLTAPISETHPTRNNFLHSELPNTSIKFASRGTSGDLDSVLWTRQVDVDAELEWPRHGGDDELEMLSWTARSHPGSLRE